MLKMNPLTLMPNRRADRVSAVEDLSQTVKTTEVINRQKISTIDTFKRHTLDSRIINVIIIIYLLFNSDNKVEGPYLRTTVQRL